MNQLPENHIQSTLVRNLTVSYELETGGEDGDGDTDWFGTKEMLFQRQCRVDTKGQKMAAGSMEA